MYHVGLKIKNPLCRYFISLQLKEDLLNGKFRCSDESYCILAGYVVQGEFGDYDPLEHEPGYLEEFPFLVSKNDRVREDVEKLHRKNR